MAQRLAMTLEGKRVLFISYNGMLDPLGQSQVLPYLRELAKRGVRFTLLSFERGAALELNGSSHVEELRKQLERDGVDWHILRYHQTPSLPATTYDVAVGTRYASRLVQQNKIDLVHARSHIPATIALRLKRKHDGLKFIFDVRGLLADEYVDADHWRKGSIPYRLTKAMERRALASADGIVTLTEKIWPIIQTWDGLRDRSVTHQVVPCCVRLDLFQFNEQVRRRRREELGLSEKLVIVYAGSIDGWYLTDKMADFFSTALRRNPSAHFLWLTRTRHDRIRQLMTERGISATHYSVIAAASDDMPSYLSAGDVGLAFIKPCFSKLASSPTKTAEYLACGLPVILNSGIGDSDALITRERVGALVQDFTEQDYEAAWKVIQSFTEFPNQTRRRTREVAERLFDVRRIGVERYARLYERVLG
jgi:glycosyltransferase involved in cell wall biosynthesis